MRLTETVETSAGKVVVRELTVGEVRAWLAGLEAKAAQVDVVDDALFEEFSLADIPLFAPNCNSGDEAGRAAQRTGSRAEAGCR